MLKFKASSSDSQIPRVKASAGPGGSLGSASSRQVSGGAGSTLEQMILKECRANMLKEQLKRTQKESNSGEHSDSGCSGGGSPPGGSSNDNAAGNEAAAMNTSLQDVPVHHGILSRLPSLAQDCDVTEGPRADDTELDFDTTCASFVVDEDSMQTDSYPRLAEIPYAPWGEHEVLNVLREGRTQGYSGNITVEIMQRLSALLQRPLTRIAREARRLSAHFLHCTKHEMQTAMKVVLSCSLFRSALQGASKAIALHTMSANCVKVSKSQRCGLRFSVGRFHRWMMDMEVAPAIDEQAAICLAACAETLLEEIVLKAFDNQKIEGPGVVPVSVLEAGVDSCAELWGLLQPFDHLVCGRNASGMVCLPEEFDMNSNLLNETPQPRSKESPTSGQKQGCAVEMLLTTGATSKHRLATVMDEALSQWNERSPRGVRAGGPRGRDPPGTGPRGHGLHWSRGAKQELWHYMKTSRCMTSDGLALKLSPLHSNTPANERVYTLSPPLVEWIRVAASFAEHRRCQVIDADDVRQAARVILPRRNCGVRFFGPLDPANFPRNGQLKQHLEAAQQHALARLLLSPERSVPVNHIPADNINACDIQGLTPLMYACAYGDLELVTDLLKAGANCNAKVPTEFHKYPYVHPELRKWTALNFAVVRGSIPILKLLLMNGSHVEGASYGFADNLSITPLQLAAASGNQEVSSWLLSQGADPYLRTSLKAGMSVADTHHGYTAFTLAAMHGHRQTVKKLLAQPIKSGYEILSLTEILSEGKPDKRSSFSSTHDGYQTIEEVFKEGDSKKPESSSKAKALNQPPKPRFTELQFSTLQECLYHAAENSHLDLALDIRQMGIPWNPHAWSKCLETAHYLQRKSVVKGLLMDFTTCSLDDLSLEFVYECLPLLLEILKEGKIDIISQQVAMVLSSLYGKAPIPPIAELRRQVSTRIDPKYVNSPELSDVHFIIEGKTFYAHKLLLATASNRFKTMLSGATKDGKIPTIELGDIKYHIFEKMMDYLYNGGMCYIQMDTKTLMELYGAAHFFHLDCLQRHCERMFSKTLSMDNCVAIYKIAKLYSSIPLLSFCEAYFLQNFQKALSKNKIFRELLFSSKVSDFDLIDGLLATLSQRVEDRITERQRTRSVRR